MVKVLIVDDSALMRRQLGQMLASEGFEVFTARNGEEGLRMVGEIDPDVVTLDVNMPEMDGLTMLSRLMVENPKPVIMVSSLTEQGALATFEALELGALDFVHKPGGTVTHNIDIARAEIVAKVRGAANARIRKARGLRDRMRADRARVGLRPASAPPTAGNVDFPALVVVGVSTGGPGTLEEVLCTLPADFAAPIVIAQHMPANFTSVFARRLNDCCPLPVTEVAQPMAVEAGTIYIGRGDADLILSNRGGRLMASAMPANQSVLWHPSVELLVRSAMKVVPAEKLIGVMLTGMGNDGAQAMTEMRKAGARTIAESADTAVVFGMPQELIKLGGAEVTLPCHRVGQTLTEWVRRAHRRRDGR